MQNPKGWFQRTLDMFVLQKILLVPRFLYFWVQPEIYLRTLHLGTDFPQLLIPLDFWTFPSFKNKLHGNKAKHSSKTLYIYKYIEIHNVLITPYIPKLKIPHVQHVTTELYHTTIGRFNLYPLDQSYRGRYSGMHWVHMYTHTGMFQANRQQTSM